MLTDNVRSGTGTRARLTNGQPAAGKTGTTQGAHDVWFVGYTPQLSVSVWMGASQGQVPLSFGGGDATGGRYPADTWGRLMNSWTEQFPITEFPEPDVPIGRRLPEDAGPGVLLRTAADRTLVGLAVPDLRYGPLPR